MSQLKFKRGEDAFAFVVDHHIRPPGADQGHCYGLVNGADDSFFIVEIATQNGLREVSSVSTSDSKPTVGDLVLVALLKFTPRLPYSHRSQKFVIRSVHEPRLVNGEFPIRSPRPTRPRPAWLQRYVVGGAVIAAAMVGLLAISPTLGQLGAWFDRTTAEEIRVLVLPPANAPRSFQELQAMQASLLPQDQIEPLDAIQADPIEKAIEKPAPPPDAAPVRNVTKNEPNRCDESDDIKYLTCTDPEIRALHSLVKDIPGYENSRRYWCAGIPDLSDLRNCIIDVANYLLTRQ